MNARIYPLNMSKQWEHTLYTSRIMTIIITFETEKIPRILVWWTLRPSPVLRQMIWCIWICNELKRDTELALPCERFGSRLWFLLKLVILVLNERLRFFVLLLLVIWIWVWDIQRQLITIETPFATTTTTTKKKHVFRMFIGCFGIELRPE